MSPVFFTVGPSELYPTVPGHMRRALEEHVPSLSHRSSVFSTFYQEAVTKLKTLLGIPESHRVFFVASGTEAMERVLQNCVADTSMHVVNGAFSRRWQKVAEELGKKTHEHAVQDGEVPACSTLEIPNGVEMICLTQNETSTGGRIPVSDIQALHARNPDVMIALDVVSSVPYVQVPWDATDAVFFSVQKGFGLPAGLGVLVVSPRAYEKSVALSKTRSVGSYHSFPVLDRYATDAQTIETPNVLGIYLLSRVTADLLARGIDTIRTTTERRAKVLYDLLDETASVKDASLRSETTLVFCPVGGSHAVIETLKNEGLMVSSGYGIAKDKHMRIANFPAHTDEQFERLITSLTSIIK